ncbi:MAG: polyprenyl diphosphate synthase [Methanoregula sp.]|nr:polyprenyl diphosphate synthase [Methanoregula sp.]
MKKIALREFFLRFHQRKTESVSLQRDTGLGRARWRRCSGRAHELGISHITLYTFSNENFSREQDEVGMLFSLFKEKFLNVLNDERVERYKIRVQMAGDRSLLPDDMKAAINTAEEATKDHTGFHLNIALAYGGRNEIVPATREILSEVERDRINPDTIDVHTVEQHLHAGKGLPPVDLIIRTGNEYRTSNFLPWLCKRSRIGSLFLRPYWPLFRKIDLLKAIRIYDQRVSAKNGA